jgi:ParB family chromosome partitioning protein
LTALPLIEQSDAWLEAVERSGGKVPSAEVVREIVEERRRPHVVHNSGEAEWYTPPEIVQAVRAVLGTIDLDPASTPEANAVVGAERIYTAADNGLVQPWAGRVYLNPPYRSSLIEPFIARLRCCYEAGEVSAAIVLVNNATETEWFAELAAITSAVCFPKGRVRYWRPDGAGPGALQGQAIAYVGKDTARFMAEFRSLGWVAVLR